MADTEPMEFQLDGVRRMENWGLVSLLADDMGLGKTFQALLTMKRNPQKCFPALVVTPASLRYNWQDEAMNHFGISSSVVDGTEVPHTVGPVPHSNRVTVVNYDVMKSWSPHFQKIGFRSIFMDECQYMIDPDSQRTVATRDVARRIPHRMALSGTPLTNRPAELWPVLNILRPDMFPHFGEYAFEYCAPYLDMYGRWNYTGARKLDQLHNLLTNNLMIRRRKDEVLKDLPGKSRQVVLMPLLKPEEYHHATTNFKSWLSTKHGAKSLKLKKALKAEQLVKVGHLLRLTARLKSWFVVQWVRSFLQHNPRKKLIVFCVHTKMLEVLVKNSPAPCVWVDGSVTGRDRQDAVNRFQKDPECRVFYGNIKACGVGLTLTAASDVAFAELPWRPGDLTQAEDRAWRISQTSWVWCHYLIAAGTIEEKLCKILQTKQQNIQHVLDGAGLDVDLDVFNQLVSSMNGVL